MAKVNLTRMDVAALLKLRGDIDNQLGARRQQLEEQLSHLGVRQGGPGQGRKGQVSSLKGRKVPIKYRDKLSVLGCRSLRHAQGGSRVAQPNKPRPKTAESTAGAPYAI
jgi:hypothetical protein